jgi:His/Glu/Gln/Arg/opine family amino acid ABC transporter permease subunit
MTRLTPSEVGYFQQLASGAVITIELAVSSYLLALASGTMVGLVTLSHNWLIQAVWRVYASVIMGVPSLLVIFPFYYGGSAVLEGVIDITPFAAGLAALVVVYTVYIAELVRGAVQYTAWPVRGLGGAGDPAPGRLASREPAAGDTVGLGRSDHDLDGDAEGHRAGLARRAKRSGGARENCRRRHQGAVHLLHHRVAVLRHLQRVDTASVRLAGASLWPRPRRG